MCGKIVFAAIAGVIVGSATTFTVLDINSINTQKEMGSVAATMDSGTAHLVATSISEELANKSPIVMTELWKRSALGDGVEDMGFTVVLGSSRDGGAWDTEEGDSESVDEELLPAEPAEINDDPGSSIDNTSPEGVIEASIEVIKQVIKAVGSTGKELDSDTVDVVESEREVDEKVKSEEGENLGAAQSESKDVE